MIVEVTIAAVVEVVAAATVVIVAILLEAAAVVSSLVNIIFISTCINSLLSYSDACLSLGLKSTSIGSCFRYLSPNRSLAILRGKQTMGVT